MISAICAAVGGFVGYKLGQYCYPPEIKEIKTEDWERPKIMTADQLRSSMVSFVEKEERPV
jgi:hypothetical protein